MGANQLWFAYNLIKKTNKEKEKWFIATVEKYDIPRLIVFT